MPLSYKPYATKELRKAIIKSSKLKKIANKLKPGQDQGTKKLSCQSGIIPIHKVESTAHKN